MPHVSRTLHDAEQRRGDICERAAGETGLNDHYCSENRAHPVKCQLKSRDHRRNHAALAPLYLGVKFVIAKSFARIHRSNLINSGIIPLVFENPADYDDFEIGQELVIENAVEQVRSNKIKVKNTATGKEYAAAANLLSLELEMILAGGKINYLNAQD